MAPRTWLQYVRLKIIVTVLRIQLRMTSGPALRRDRALIPKEVTIERIEIPSRDAGRRISADLYLPSGDPEPASSSPVLVNWHGSGFIFPLLGSDALFCARMATSTGAAVLDADYRKGPEVPFPGPMEDVEDVLLWVARQARFDPNRVAVSGFSAGGTLALAAASSLRAKLVELLDIVAVVSCYPMTDLTIPAADRHVPHPIKPHPVWALDVFMDSYAPDKSTRSDPLVSPGLADPANYAPTVVIISCDGDTFMPEEVQLAERIHDHHEVSNPVLRGMPHAFDKGCERDTPQWDMRDETYVFIAKTLLEAFGP